ncbi:hypothetical protein BsWGS_27127 [Bradybaena similaris]
MSPLCLLLTVLVSSSLVVHGFGNLWVTQGETTVWTPNDKLSFRHTTTQSPALAFLRPGNRQIWSPLDQQRHPDKAAIERALHSRENPFISESHLETTRELQENKRQDVTDETYREMLGDLPADTHLNYITSSKRQLPMLRLEKRVLCMLRLGKRQLPMLRLRKRQLCMLRLGKRQLPMLSLGKRLRDRDGEPVSGYLPTGHI